MAKAIEESANEPPRPSTVNVKILDDPDEIRELIHKVNQASAAKAALEEEK